MLIKYDCVVSEEGKAVFKFLLIIFYTDKWFTFLC